VAFIKRKKEQEQQSNKNKKGKQANVRWYKPGEWHKLSAEQKKSITQAREARKASENATAPKTQTVASVIVADTTSTVSAITSQRQQSDQSLKKADK
jgi:hypothetical protein